MLANGKIHAGKQNTYTQLQIRTALWRVFKLCGRCGVRDYRQHRQAGEPSADGILYRCRGRWNWLLASFDIPTQKVGRPIKRRVFASRPIRRKAIKRPCDPGPIEKPKRRNCLNCEQAIISVHYTCDRCRATNSLASTGSYL